MKNSVEEALFSITGLTEKEFDKLAEQTSLPILLGNKIELLEAIVDTNQAEIDLINMLENSLKTTSIVINEISESDDLPETFKTKLEQYIKLLEKFYELTQNRTRELFNCYDFLKEAKFR